ncbi:MAG: penicillin-binding transpeptidase domain-containing protein [Terriglobia bacterium]
MTRRSFLAGISPLMLTLACRRASDTRIIKPRGEQEILLTCDKHIQSIAEREIAAPLRSRINNQSRKDSLPKDTDCALVCLANDTGDVLAYIPTLLAGSEFDNNRRTGRDVGSVIKPLIYAEALEIGVITQNDTFRDAPMSFPHRDGNGNYTVRNYHNGYTYRSLSIEDAIALSSNVAMTQAYHRIPLAALREWISRLKLPEPDDLDRLQIGRWAIAPLQLASAFTALAAEGRVARPKFIVTTKLSDGKQVDEPITKSEKVYSAHACETVSRGMRACLVKGTGQVAADLASCARGKTGTSSTDALSVLQSRVITTVLWVGRRQYVDLGLAGGRTCMPLLANLFRVLRRARPELIPSWE